ncbi:hypothetical protein ABID19_003191 [Mesorhizobium robiniae]|uniref:Uncharacterized protein n=1 Tax=Mesorhizobium robiniae TaxID=559315 RepID=A0ABV2GPD8_9HYPH
MPFADDDLSRRGNRCSTGASGKYDHCNISALRISKSLNQSLLKYEETTLGVRVVEYFRVNKNLQVVNKDLQAANLRLAQELSVTNDALIQANTETERQRSEVDHLRSQMGLATSR